MSNRLKTVLGVVLGGTAGYAYYHFVGCNNGCAIQSNWLYMTLYGMIAGFVVAMPTKKKTKFDNEIDNSEDKH